MWNLESLKAGENSNKTSSQNKMSESEDDRQIAEHIIHDLEAGVELETRDWYWGELPDGEVRVKSVFFKGQGGRVVSDQDLLLLSNLKSLESIEFGQTAITSDGFVQLGKLTSLKKLGFSVEALTNDGLAKLQQLPRLESLELIHTDVTDDGLEILAGFSALRNLSLSVSPKKKFGPGYLSDEGLSHLASIPRLEQLSLYGPTFTDRGIEHLSQLKGLDCLRIWAPNITDTGIQKLQEQLPDCEVMDKR